ncbi:MAG: hypothetical protein WBR26_20780 [Candidatus Acidiferrum sp.]
MQRLRMICAAVLAAALVGVPVWGTPALPNVSPLGTIITADRAHVGEAGADVGTTIYDGDLIKTELQGSLQLRAGAARLLLQSSSSAIVNNGGGFPSAKLLSGAATFSTAKADAFTLFASTAEIRPQTDAPTVGQVSYMDDKEIVVTARRSALIVTVAGDTQVVQEGQSYRVLLDTSDAQGPAGAGGGGPLKAGRSRFLLIATALVAVGTGIAIYYACESNDRPH